MKKVIALFLVITTLMLILTGCFDPKDKTDENTLILGNNQSLEAGEELKVEKNELLSVLIENLHNTLREYELPYVSMEEKINGIKDGKEPLLISFEQSDCYFICAYFNDTHDEMLNSYCCAHEYTWVKFKDEASIPDSYNDKEIKAVFQIDGASLVMNILTNEENTHSIEYYQRFNPEFTNGLNTKAPISFDKKIIYLNSHDRSNLYHSASLPEDQAITIPCIYLNDKYFIVEWLYTLLPNENKKTYTDALKNNYGKYYGAGRLSKSAEKRQKCHFSQHLCSRQKIFSPKRAERLWSA